MKQTQNYQLNQWEMTDRIQMEDFNRDNQKIETALEGKLGRAKMLRTVSASNNTSILTMDLSDIHWDEWECLLFTINCTMTSPGSSRALACDLGDVSLLGSEKRPYFCHQSEIAGPCAAMLLPFHNGSHLVQLLSYPGGFFIGTQPFNDLQVFQLHSSGATSITAGASMTLWGIC